MFRANYNFMNRKIVEILNNSLLLSQSIQNIGNERMPNERNEKEKRKKKNVQGRNSNRLSLFYSNLTVREKKNNNNEEFSPQFPK